MRDFKQYCIENNLDDMFGDGYMDDIREKIKKRGKEVKRERKTEPFGIELLRGFDADLNTLEKQGENFLLSPKQSEQGVMWFSHMHITHYDYRDYVKGRGEWLLTYPLQATKHYDNVTYEDGSVEARTPEELQNKAVPTEPSQWRAMWGSVVELPSGWLWSYKTEKFITTTNKITVHPSMITKMTLFHNQTEEY